MSKLAQLVAKLRLPVSYDTDVQIGYGRFTLPEDHPFFPAARVHDAHYDDLIARTSSKTLKQIDREFLSNCLRIAASEAWLQSDIALGVHYVREAWLLYRIVRAWATFVRPELEAYRPITRER